MFQLSMGPLEIVVIATIVYGVPIILLFISIISFAYIRGSNILKEPRKLKKSRWLYCIPAATFTLTIIWVWYVYSH